TLKPKRMRSSFPETPLRMYLNPLLLFNNLPESRTRIFVSSWMVSMSPKRATLLRTNKSISLL
ncbi:hypothetical protein K7432_005965, partial [Basidiobolus ranarum]